jgi:hypothetical protein
VNRWVVDGNQVISNITWFSTNWTVPSNPSNRGSQIVYFFNGIEPSSGGIARSSRKAQSARAYP